MKSRIIKAGFIIAVATLFLFNIQLLFNTSDSGLFNGSTATAFVKEDLPNMYLDTRRCLLLEGDIDWGLFGPIICIEFSIDSKKTCRRIDKDSSCDEMGQVPCGGIAD